MFGIKRLFIYYICFSSHKQNNKNMEQTQLILTVLPFQIHCARNNKEELILEIDYILLRHLE